MRTLTTLWVLPLLAIVPAMAAAQTSGGAGTATGTTGAGAPATTPDQAPTQAREGASGLTDIIVTATRRETNVQDTPLAISAIGGDALRGAGVTDPAQLSSLAPGLVVDQGLGSGQTHISIRGVASSDFSLSSNNPVALNLDDVYQPFQFGLSSQIFDMNRIEVLRGPQGTLFGKNSTSGTVNYYSQTPTMHEEGYFLVDGGSGDYTAYAVEGAFNRPLSSDLALRVSFRAEHRDPYVDNIFDGSKLGVRNTINGRVQLAWHPAEGTRVNLKVFGNQSKGDGAIYAATYLSNPCAAERQAPRSFFPGPYLCPNGVTPEQASIDSRRVSSDRTTAEDYDSYGATLKVDQSLGKSALTSITSWSKGHYALLTNSDGVGADAFLTPQFSRTEQYSQEVRVATPSENALKVIVGGFGQIDRIKVDQGSNSVRYGPFFDYATLGTGTQTTRSLAAFGSATWDIAPILSVTGGVRYSNERKTVYNSLVSVFGPDLDESDNTYDRVVARYGAKPVLTFRDSKTFQRVTYDGTVNLKPAERVLVYARYASGFRSGGYVVGITSAAQYNPAKPYFDPETVRSIELGFKSELFDRVLRINGAIYRNSLKDLQLQVSASGGQVVNYLTNAANATVKGAELEVELAPARGLRLTGSVGYNDAKFGVYDTGLDANRPRGGVATGNTLPYAPRWTANGGATYQFDADADHSVILSSNWRYRSRIYFNAYEEDLSSDRGRVNGDIRVSYGTRDKGWRLTAYVDNLTNQIPKTFVFPFGGLGRVNSFVIAPTIYGLGRRIGGQVSFGF